MSKTLLHAGILVIAIAFAFLFSKTSLAQYDLQLIALLFIILFLVKRFAKTSRLTESVVFTLIVLIIVNTSGGVGSAFFFLVYFLLFSLALLLEPVISIVATLTLIVFFSLSLPENQGLSTLLPIFSLAFLTPFALFMGKEFEKEQEAKRKEQKNKQDTFLFMSLVMKNHLASIKKNLENFMGDHELGEIKKTARKMEQQIEEFEKGS